jgi:hypothetical protein
MSSCSRRQLARRRPGRGAMRVQLLLVIALILVAAAAFVAGRGWL